MTTPTVPAGSAAPQPVPPTVPTPLRRFSSSDLMDGQREVEIEHMGRVYRLRITQLNKLILTA
jgi:hemin uptake protein HemP